MHIYSINSFDCKPRNLTTNKVQSTSFGNKENERKLPELPSSHGSKALKNAVLATLFLPIAGTVATSCNKDDDVSRVDVRDSVYASAYAYAYAGDTVRSQGHHCGDSCACHNGRDTVFVDRTNWDTVYVDTGSYHHDTDTITLWKDRYERPIPLDTLAKHTTDWDIDSIDTVGRRNIIHYEYTRPWEYNTRVIANMNQLESSYNKNVLVHDVEVKDYKGNHKYYGKEVRRIPEFPVTLEYYNGGHVDTDKGMFLELHRNKGDRKNASIFGGTTLQARFFLQTAGDSVKVFREDENGIFVEDGRMAKGYLGKNTILLKDLIGEYSTEDHLTDVNIVAVDDETLKDAYVRKRDEEEASK